MDQEFLKLIFSQGIVATLLFFALKWLLKDRDRLLESVSNAQKDRITLLETVSANRTQELAALHSEFSSYRMTMQSELSAIHAKHSEQIISVTATYNNQIAALTASYNTQIAGLQQEIRGLYKTMLESKLCPIDKDSAFKPAIIMEAGKQQ